MKKKNLLISAFALAMLISGCTSNNQSESKPDNRSESSSVVTGNSSSSSSEKTSSEASVNSGSEASGNSSAIFSNELEVCFGDDGVPFILHLYENDTAKAIARHVGTADWRLPIYHYDDYENWEVMQYYDIPSRYEIPSNPEKVTSEKAGEVYYSEPNRIILFYGDANVSSEYTKVGYFDFSEEFKQAVVNNPVLEGWGNKIVLINSKNR